MTPPPTLGDLLRHGERLLKASCQDRSRHLASHLLEGVTKLDKTFITLNPERVLNPEMAEEFTQGLQRLLAGEPLSRILGHRDFWKDTFYLSPETLDPRPDSETLIESVLKLEAIPDTILDLGVGSGCLLLSLLREFNKATGVGVDRSFAALSTAQDNSERLGFTDRCHFIQSHWLNALQGKFDLIISNPPYIPSQEIQLLDRNVQDYDPLLALDGGSDGLMAYQEIAKTISVFLTNQGHLVLEIGQNQENDVKQIFLAKKLHIIKEDQDLGGITRVLTFKK